MQRALLRRRQRLVQQRVGLNDAAQETVQESFRKACGQETGRVAAANAADILYCRQCHSQDECNRRHEQVQQLTPAEQPVEAAFTTQGHGDPQGCCDDDCNVERHVLQSPRLPEAMDRRNVGQEICVVEDGQNANLQKPHQKLVETDLEKGKQTIQIGRTT